MAAVRQAQHKEEISVHGKSIAYYDLDTPDFPKMNQSLKDAFASVASAVDSEDTLAAVRSIFMDSKMSALLISVSRLAVFSPEVAEEFKHDLGLLKAVKTLKYFYASPISSVVFSLSSLGAAYSEANWLGFAMKVASSEIAKVTLRQLGRSTPGLAILYKENAEFLECADPHAVYPTSMYRVCDGRVNANQNASVIEGVMSTTITTTIKIQTGVLDTANRTLCEVYKPIGKCVAVIDKFVEENWGDKIAAYFEHHGIELIKLVYRSMEADKDISTVELILHDMKKQGVSRNEPVLIVGGGVIADVGGFAAALYHRNTAYIMLCTSIVSGIDAGPSPRTCCDGFGYKNLYGAYHPPVLTLTDRTFFKTLKPGWVRHGIAEIIKMAVVKDLSLFELLEKAGPRLISTKFGTECPEDVEFGQLCDAIIGKAMEGYVKSEYVNLWETHQCRPHAYGHTWSPGYEIPAGMLHGHAVATGMGFGAYLAAKENFITEAEAQRIYRLISDLELSLWHPILDDYDVVWASQEKMTQKRGGNLCAPVPKGQIGACGYINDVDRERLERELKEYKSIVNCSAFPRNGAGIDPHCADVGLEHPGTTGVAKNLQMGDDSGSADDEAVEPAAVSTKLELGTWSERMEEMLSEVGDSKNSDSMRTRVGEIKRWWGLTQSFLEKHSTPLGAAVLKILAETEKGDVFPDGMDANWALDVQSAQTLDFFASLKAKTGKKAWDLGTLTGISAAVMSQHMDVVTVEREPKLVAFARSNLPANVEVVQSEIVPFLQERATAGEKADLIFMDLDKTCYLPCYEAIMSAGLLAPGGILVCDNVLYRGLVAQNAAGEMPAVSEKTAANAAALKQFVDRVGQDKDAGRVRTLMMPVRDGILAIATPA
jgi:3-dehydroquinate synthase